jgi:hypothetical protein
MVHVWIIMQVLAVAPDSTVCPNSNGITSDLYSSLQYSTWKYLKEDTYLQ